MQVRTGAADVDGAAVDGGLGYQVRAADRALRILTCFSEEQPSLSLREIYAKLDLPKSTTFKLVQVLEHLGFLAQEPEGGKYRIGSTAFHVGKLYLAGRDLPEIAAPHLRALANRFGNVVSLATFDRGQVVQLASVEPWGSFRFMIHPTSRAEFHCSSIGKALLAHLEPAVVDSLLQTAGLPRHTANTIVDPEELRAHLRVARQRGYTVDDEEGMRGLRCVGAPVFDHRGEVVAAISVSAPIFDLTLDALPEYAATVMATAASISEQLGTPPRAVANGFQRV